MRDNYRRRWVQRLEQQEQDQIIAELLDSDRPVAVTNAEGELLRSNAAGRQAIAKGLGQAELNLPLQGQRRLLLWPEHGEQQSPRQLLVATLQEAISQWEKAGHSRLHLAEHSGQWRVQLDGSTARSRTFDRYTALTTLPGRPNVDRVISTVRFAVQQLGTPCAELQNLLERVEALRATNPRIFTSG